MYLFWSVRSSQKHLKGITASKALQRYKQFEKVFCPYNIKNLIPVTRKKQRKRIHKESNNMLNIKQKIKIENWKQK